MDQRRLQDFYACKIIFLFLIYILFHTCWVYLYFKFLYTLNYWAPALTRSWTISVWSSKATPGVLFFRATLSGESFQSSFLFKSMLGCWRRRRTTSTCPSSLATLSVIFCCSCWLTSIALEAMRSSTTDVCPSEHAIIFPVFADLLMMKMMKLWLLWNRICKIKENFEGWKNQQKAKTWHILQMYIFTSFSF